MNGNARRAQLVGQRGIARQGGRGFDNSCDLNACRVQRQRAGYGLVGAAQHHGGRAGKPTVETGQNLRRVEPGDARRVPPREGQAHVAPPGGNDDPFALYQPVPCLCVDQPGNRPRHPAHVRLVREQAPAGRAQPHVNAHVEQFGQLGPGIQHLFQHRGAVGNLRAHAPAPKLRNMLAHDLGRDGVFIDQHHLRALCARLARGGAARWPGADHKQLHLLGNLQLFAGDRFGVNLHDSPFSLFGLA